MNLGFRSWCQQWGLCRWLFNIHHLPDLPPFRSPPDLDPQIVELRRARHAALNRLTAVDSTYQVAQRRQRRAEG